MERPIISAEDLCYHHAKFIVRFFPDQAVDYILGIQDQEQIKGYVKNRCRDIGQSYHDIMNLAHNRQWDEIQRMKAQSDPQSQNSSLPSTPMRPTIPFANPGFTNQNPPPSPAPTASTSKSHMPSHPERITVMGERDTHLTMRPSRDGWNWISTDVVYGRLQGVRVDPGTGGGPAYASADFNAPPLGPSVELPFYRQASADSKSHQMRFYLDDRLEQADVLVNYDRFHSQPRLPPHEVSGGPPTDGNQYFSHMPHTQTAEYGAPSPNDYYGASRSHHASSITTRSPYRSSTYNAPIHSMMNMPAAPTPPVLDRGSPVQRAPPSGIHEPQPTRMNNTSNISQEHNPAEKDYNKVTGEYYGPGSKKGPKRTFDLCPTGDSFISTSKKVCRLLKIPFDRAALCVDFVSMSDQSSHLVSLDDETFRDDWPMAVEFLQTNRSEGGLEPDFMIKIESLDDGG